MLRNVKTRRFTRAEYYKMAETGVLARGERVELIDGEIVPMSPQNLPHSLATGKSTTVFVRNFAASHIVRCQCPLTLANDCEPEPDFAVVTPAHLESCTQQGIHPSRPDLVMEISDSSVNYDTVEKAELYARAGIPEYWVLNLRSRKLEVRRDASTGAYTSVTLLNETELVYPWFAPDCKIRVAELLP